MRGSLAKSYSLFPQLNIGLTRNNGCCFTSNQYFGFFMSKLSVCIYNATNKSLQYIDKY